MLTAIRGVLTLLLFAATAWSVSPARADESADSPSFVAAGDDKSLWLVALRPGEGDKLMVLHREASEDVQALHRALNVTGPLAPGGAAAAEGALWLVYHDMSVQSLTTLRDPATGLKAYRRPAIEPGLPLAVKLRTLAAAPGQPWALVSVQGARQLRAIDHPDAPVEEPAEDGDTVRADESSGDNEDEPSPPAEDAAAPGAEDDTAATDETASTGDASTEPAEVGTPAAAGVTDEAAEPVERFDPVDRLLVLRRGDWEKVDLPADWVNGDAAAIVMRGRDKPRLLRAVDSNTVRVYEQTEDAWSSVDFILPGVGDRGMSAVQSNQLLLIAVPAEVETGIALDVHEVWGEGDTALRGRLALPDVAPDTPFAFVATGTWLALVARDESAIATWTAMTRQGAVDLEPTAFVVQSPRVFTDQPDRLVFVAVLAASMLLLLVIWKRDQGWNTLNLPADVQIADVSRRLMAAVIDLAPCLVASLVLFGRPFEDFHRVWPGLGGGWPDVLPGLTAIGMNVVHAAITEMFTARSFGKMVMRIRVCTLDNKPPNVWQVLARNVLKAFDLTAWYVLPIIALIVPNRQRLGDMVARTVVVSDAVEPGGDD